MRLNCCYKDCTFTRPGGVYSSGGVFNSLLSVFDNVECWAISIIDDTADLPCGLRPTHRLNSFYFSSKISQQNTHFDTYTKMPKRQEDPSCKSPYTQCIKTKNFDRFQRFDKVVNI